MNHACSPPDLDNVLAVGKQNHVQNFHARKCMRIIRRNTPAMPLYDAHFGGFFASGGCR